MRSWQGEGGQLNTVGRILVIFIPILFVIQLVLIIWSGTIGDPLNLLSIGLSLAIVVSLFYAVRKGAFRS